MDTAESLTSRAQEASGPARRKFVHAPERPDADRRQPPAEGSVPARRDRREREAMVAAATLLVVAGAFQVMTGVYALTNAATYAQAAFRLQDWSSTIWGWAQVSIGAVLGILSIGLLGGWEWAFIAGFFAAAVSAALGVVLFPYYPAWALIILTFDVVVCGLLVRYGFGIHSAPLPERTYSELGIDASWARRYSSTNAVGGPGHRVRPLVEED